MAATDLAFTAHGVPAPQGSHRAFVNPATGRAIVTQDNKKTKPWREAVKHAALQQMGDTWARIEGPVSVALTFYMPRPKGHYGSGRNADIVKASSPAYPTTKPDIDKLTRATLDALTDAGVYRDDSQVTELEVIKRYADDRAPCAHIRVTDIDALLFAVASQLGAVRLVEDVDVQGALL